MPTRQLDMPSQRSSYSLLVHVAMVVSVRAGPKWSGELRVRPYVKPSQFRKKQLYSRQEKILGTLKVKALFFTICIFALTLVSLSDGRVAHSALLTASIMDGRGPRGPRGRSYNPAAQDVPIDLSRWLSLCIRAMQPCTNYSATKGIRHKAMSQIFHVTAIDI